MKLASWRKPDEQSRRQFLESQRGLPFTYSGIGGTAEAAQIPAGYAVDRTSVTLGRGAATFAAARRGIERWAQFDLGWCEAWPRTTPIRVGESVAVVARGMGAWWINAARIAYVVDDFGGDVSDPSQPTVSRFGFAYGTLPEHVEMGEELFLVEWDRASDDVCYHIFAFSRPRHPLARLGGPLVRRLQRRFREDSAAAMRRSIRDDVASAGAIY